MASKKVLQNRINRFLDKLKEDNIIYPNLVISKDGLEDDVPYLQAQTDYQNINITIGDNGETVTCATRMRKGTGTEKEFNKKIAALTIVRKYVKHKFKGDEYQVKETLDNIKVTSADTIYTLTFDYNTNEVVTKTRARRGTKNAATSNVNKNNKQVTGKLENVEKSMVPEPATQNKQVAGKLEPAAATKSFVPKKPKKLKDDPYICDGLTTTDIHFVEECEYEEWPQGTIVANIYSKKHYTVQQDMKNVIEVSSAEAGYQTMARADLRRIS